MTPETPPERRIDYGMRMFRTAFSEAIQAQIRELERQGEDIGCRIEALRLLEQGPWAEAAAVHVEQELRELLARLDRVLVDVFCEVGPKLRLGDAVEMVVRERRIPATPDEILGVLKSRPDAFRERGRGWWEFTGKPRECLDGTEAATANP